MKSLERFCEPWKLEEIVQVEKKVFSIVEVSESYLKYLESHESSSVADSDDSAGSLLPSGLLTGC